MLRLREIVTLLVSLAVFPTLYAQQWSIPEKLPPPINEPGSRSSFSFITRDSNRLYFASDRINRSTEDIYYSTWPDTGWSPALNIGSPINTTFPEWSCDISADGMMLIFDCYHYRHSADPQVNPPDLCFSVKTDTGWSYPKLIFDNYEDNSGWEVAPSFSGDGRTMYFQRFGNSPRGREIWYTKFEGGIWRFAQIFG